MLFEYDKSKTPEKNMANGLQHLRKMLSENERPDAVVISANLILDEIQKHAPSRNGQ